MYQLVSRISDGLTELRTLLEDHITQQGLSAIEREGEAAHNDPKVCYTFLSIIYVYKIPFRLILKGLRHYYSGCSPKIQRSRNVGVS